MVIVTLLAILAIVAAGLFLLHVVTRRDPQAEYTYREQAGLLTAEEIRVEAMEERANYEKRTSAKDSNYFARGGDA